MSLFSFNAFSVVDSVTANSNEFKELNDDVINSQNSANAVAANGTNAKIDTNHFDITTSGNSTAAVSSGNNGEIFINNSKVTATGKYAQGVNARLGGNIIRDKNLGY